MKLIKIFKRNGARFRENRVEVKVRDGFVAWDLRNKIEMEGYKVELKKRGGHYTLVVWGKFIDSFFAF